MKAPPKPRIFWKVVSGSWVNFEEGRVDGQRGGRRVRVDQGVESFDRVVVVTVMGVWEKVENIEVAQIEGPLAGPFVVEEEGRREGNLVRAAARIRKRGIDRKRREGERGVVGGGVAEGRSVEASFVGLGEDIFA